MAKGSRFFNTKLTFAVMTGSLGVITLIAVILAHVMLYLATSTSANQEREDAALHAARNAAGSVGNLVSLLDASVTAHIGDPRLAQTLLQGDPGLVRQEEDRLTRAVSNAWLVRLLPENLDTPDEARTPKMGFSDLHMVTSAVSGSVAPAIHLANSPDAHLTMAKRLQQGGGVLHASWPIKLLQGALVFDGACGVALQQESVDILYQGGGDCRADGQSPAGVVAVKGAPWQIAYWVLPGAPTNIYWFGGSLLLSLLLIGAVTLLLIRLQYAALRQDRKSLVNLANDMINANPLGDYKFKIKEIEHFAADISKIKRIQRETKAVGRGVEASAPSRPDIPSERLDELPTFGDSKANKPSVVDIPQIIFRANDIRGILGETITPDIFYALGLAIGTEMAERAENFIAVGHDGRLSSPELCKSLCNGLVDTGRTVINIGMVPTPLMYFATHTLNAQSGVIVTGSHNPPNYNGLKIVLSGDTLSGADIQSLGNRARGGHFAIGKGRMKTYNLLPEYIERVVGDTQLGRPLKVVLDCGNGSASVVAPKLIKSIGCEVIELFCDVDGHFPNHHPDPGNPDNLQALIKKVVQAGADLGIAYDGDGDRLGLVDSGGKIIWPDRQMMVFAADVLSREPGADIIFDVKCTRNLPSHIVNHGGRPIMAKTGHAPMKAKLKETGAMLAGEMSGHIFFQERWYGFDDAVYASARMVEILSNQPATSAEVFAELPDSVCTPELGVLMEEGENAALMAKLVAFAEFPDARVITIDGLRVDFLEGWGLVRASNTLPALTFRFEADNEKALAHIQTQFRDLILQVKPDIELPF